MKKLLFILMTMILILNTAQSAFAYSYGDPGEEKLAEAYKELKGYVEQDDWQNARAVYDTYEKEFTLYFVSTTPFIEKAFEEQDKEILLESYRAALRLNIERRLHFAEEQFDDYGQAKLLLAKARGTFNVLEPYYLEEKGQEAVNAIYSNFDESLTSLGNPGLFGIGSQQSDKETFIKNINFINSELIDVFPVPSEEDEAHLAEENLDFLNKNGEEGNSAFWLWFSIILIAAFVILVIVQKRKKK